MGADDQDRRRHRAVLGQEHHDVPVRIRQLPLLIGLAVVAGSPAARADDAADELTVLPWTQASLTLAAEEERGVVSFVHSWRSLGIHVKASAPLDKDSRIAAFTESNSLVGGFAGSLEIGFDTRAEYLRDLESVVTTIEGAVDELSALSAWTRTGLATRFLTRVNAPLPHTLSQAGTSLCLKVTGRTCGSPDEIAEMLVAACPVYLSRPCGGIDEFFDVATTYFEERCIVEKDGVEAAKDTDQCALAGFGIEVVASTRAHAALTRITSNAAVRNEILSAYREIDPKAHKDFETCVATRGAGSENQCLVEQAGAIATTFREFLRTAPARRRDFLVSAIRDLKRWDVALMLGTSVSYDRAKVFQDDAASDATDATAYELALGPDITVYTPVTGLSLNARAGFTVARSLGADTFERCTPVNSTDAMVTGQQCDTKALFREGPAPDRKASAFVRGAVDYQFRGTPSMTDVIPGVELRGGLRGIGQDLVGEWRVSLFATPIANKAAGRFGFAVDFRYAIDHDPTSDDPRLVVTPMIFIGASLGDLMSN